MTKEQADLARLQRENDSLRTVLGRICKEEANHRFRTTMFRLGDMKLEGKFPGVVSGVYTMVLEEECMCCLIRRPFQPEVANGP